MKFKQVFISTILVTVFLAGCRNNESSRQADQPVKVELKKVSSGWQLFRNNEPFFVMGAGLECGNMEALARSGGNALRTWRTDNRCRSGKNMLDEARENGLMVCLGIEIARERHGFDYSDTAAVNKQYEYARSQVIKYKDHPALLAWGIGNELNLHSKNPRVWDAVNDIARMIHQIDPNHPVTTMLAGAGRQDILTVTERCPEIDFLSFQLYGDIVNLPGYIRNSGYAGAYIVSEWGATGHWEVSQTRWGSPIEQTSHEKAMAFRDRYQKAIASQAGQCIGSFVFLWGQKQERTPTWYGMFLESGQQTEAVDVMQYMWTGQWPENRSPVLKNCMLDGKTMYDNIYLQPNQTYVATAEVEDPDRDPLTYRWEIIPEVPENLKSEGGDYEPRQPTVLSEVTQNGYLSFEAPVSAGAYRLFVYASDGNNHAATANIPFYIR